MKDIELFYFGEIGFYDEYNPQYVCSQKGAGRILYIIAENEPYSISDREIISQAEVTEEEFKAVITGLLRIEAVTMKKGRYKINFPVFCENDIKFLNGYMKDAGKVLGDIVMSQDKEIHRLITKLSGYGKIDERRLRYHIICDSIFDGIAFDIFDKEKLVTVSKAQPGARDYIIIGYEKSEVVDNYSKLLLCSSNNYRSQHFRFNSFGDADGKRKDIYRFFRMVQESVKKTPGFNYEIGSYIRINEENNYKLAENCGRFITQIYESPDGCLDIKDENRSEAEFLETMEYISINDGKAQCRVPVFTKEDQEIIEEISKVVMYSIIKQIGELLSHIAEDCDNLTAVCHGVDIKDIGNELWHMIFGSINEYLAKKDYVENPVKVAGQGRYLRSFNMID